MFSMSPRTFAPRVSDALIALEQTSVDTSCGVVTMTTPSRSGIDFKIAVGSSPVPGGRSTRRKSSPPHFAAERS
jgi:hypothetical protein